MQKLDTIENSLTLVILAAGVGSRFGGDKPLAAVGPAGQSLFEYSVHDAYAAGFKHVVFVVSSQQDTTEFSVSLQCYGDNLKIDFVVQSISDFVQHAKAVTSQKAKENSKLANNAKPNSKDNGAFAARKKPWGTAHAVLVCRNYINNPFLVITADDYYGQSNYEAIGRYLIDNRLNSSACVLAGYKLENTLSSSGGVNRGVCKVDSDGYLESIREVVNISFDQSLGQSLGQLEPSQIDEFAVLRSSIVSMTFWGFLPSFFDILENEFQIFLKETPALDQSEFYLPEAVNQAMLSGLLQVKVFDTIEKWQGLTYADDLAEVREFILKLTGTGAYDGMGDSHA